MSEINWNDYMPVVEGCTPCGCCISLMKLGKNLQADKQQLSETIVQLKAKVTELEKITVKAQKCITENKGLRGDILALCEGHNAKVKQLQARIAELTKENEYMIVHWMSENCHKKLRDRIAELESEVKPEERICPYCKIKGFADIPHTCPASKKGNYGLNFESEGEEMAMIKTQMQAVGNEPQTCIRKFERGESMFAVVYKNGDPADWHTKDCIDHWRATGSPLCEQEGE